MDASELGRWEKALLREDRGDTTKEAAAERLEGRGLLRIDSRWALRPGSPGFSAMGGRRDATCIGFVLTEAGEKVRRQLLDDPTL